MKKWLFALLAAFLLTAGAPCAPQMQFPTMARIRWEEADGATVLTVERDGDVWRLQAVRCGEKGEVRRTARAVTRDRDPARQADRLVQKVRKDF